MTTYEPHPTNLAYRYLDPNGDAWKRLLADLKEHGQRVDIVLGRGTRPNTKVILDGKNLQKACLELGLVPRYVDFEGPHTPRVYAAFIQSRNWHRRHDDASQRAITARRLAMLEVGRPRKSRLKAELSQREAGHLLNVSERSMQRAGEVLKRGVPELVQAVEAGELDVTKAAEIARMPKREQRGLVKAAAAGVDVGAELRVENRLSVAHRLTDSELRHLGALAELGASSRDPLARAGVVVLRKLVPALGAL